MQSGSNKELRESSSGKKKGLFGTLVVHSILFSLLILVGFSSPPPPAGAEEGILVNFGTGETGMGLVEPSAPAGKEETSPPVNPVVMPVVPHQKSAAPKNREEPMLTQDKEESPSVKKEVPVVVKKTDPDAEKKRLEKKEADRILKEQIETERIRVKEEEAERKRIAAETQRKADIMDRTKNALANSKNSGTSSTSEGIAGGTGNQGDPNGSIDSKVRGTGSGLGDKGTGTGGPGGKGISYDLQGRGIQSFPAIKYDYQGDGIVVVSVSVNQSGKVIQATPGIKGSTTLDENLLRIAKEAALGTSFEVKKDAPAVQKGTISITFKLN